MALHVVVLEIGQVIHAAVEGDGKLAGGSHVAEEDVRDGQTALLARIPGLEDGVAGFGLGNQADGAAGEVHEDDLLAGVMQGLQEVALHLRELDVRAVAALEAGQLHRHLLAFQAGRDAAREDHDVDVLQALEHGIDVQFREEVLLPLLLAADVVLDILHADGVLLRDGLQLGAGHVAGLLERVVRIGLRHELSGNQAAAADILDARNPLLEGVVEGNRPVRYGIVVAPLHLRVIAVGAHQRNPRIGSKRQDAPLVLEEDHRLLRHLPGKGEVFLPFHDGRRKVVPEGDVVHLAQAVAGREQTDQVPVQVLFIQQAAFHGLRNMTIGTAAFGVHAGVDGQSRRGGDIGHVLVMVLAVEVVDGAAVGGDDALVAPFTPEDLVDELVGSAAGNAAEAVVGRHHFLDIGLDHQVLEGREVGLAEVAFGNDGVIAVAVPFRAGVDGVVLRAGVGLQDRGIRRSLQAADDGHAQLARQVRILAVGFHAPSPARVAEDVDVRGPEGDALILLHQPRLPGLVVLHPGLVADGREDFVNQRFIEGGGHADGLREHRGGPVAGDTVQRLAPPVVGLDAQGGHRGGRIHGQGHLFLQGQAGDEVRRPLFGRQGTVFVGLCRQGGRHGAEHQD